jgi:hypothetical protein
MAVSGKVREQKEWKKSTGFFEGEVLCINPDREKLEQLLGVTLEKDPEYLGTKTEEVELPDGSKKNQTYTKLDVVIWLRDVKTDAKRSVKFFLKDLPKLNKEKTKTQYINSIGVVSWADKPENLPEWFTAREYRPAHQGEEDLYNFITSWLAKVDFKDAESLISFDWAKLMKGNTKEIAENMNGPYAGTVVCLCLISTTEKEVDGVKEKKEYEQVYNRDFLPGYIMKDVRLRTINDDFIAKAKATEKKKKSRLQKFVLQVTDKEWGIKDYFTLGELKEYDPKDNVAASSTAHINEGDATY